MGGKAPPPLVATSAAVVTLKGAAAPDHRRQALGSRGRRVARGVYGRPYLQRSEARYCRLKVFTINTAIWPRVLGLSGQ